MRFLVTSIIIVSLFFSCSTADKKESADDKNMKILQESVESTDQNFVNGKKELENGKLELALKFFEKSAYSEAVFYTAYIHMQMGRVDAAKEHFQKCTEKNILKAEAHYNLGLIHFETKDSDSAKKHMEHALKAEPKHTGALYFLGNMSYIGGDMDSALKYYRQALKVDPGSKDLWNAVLAVLLNKQDFERAWKIRENVEMTPDNVNNLLIVAEKTGNYSKGIDFVPENLKNVPSIKILVRTLMVREGKFAEALESARGDITEEKPFAIIDRYKKDKASHAIILKKEGLVAICSSNPEKPLELKFEDGKVKVTDPAKEAEASKVTDLLSEVCEGVGE